MTETEPQNRRLGYARQHLWADARRVARQLRAEGCTKIYREKASGAQPDRRELLRMLKALAPGDVVISPENAVTAAIGTAQNSYFEQSLSGLGWGYSSLAD